MSLTSCQIIMINYNQLNSSGLLYDCKGAKKYPYLQDYL